MPNVRFPKFTEDDYVAAVAARLRELSVADITLEEVVFGTRDRKDIAVRRGGRLEMIIEVKRPDRLAAGEPADEQVAGYGRQEQCDAVAWTDGNRFFQLDLKTGETMETRILKSGLGLYGPTRRGISTVLRPGYFDEDLLEYPKRQRALCPSPVLPELHVRRREHEINISEVLADAAVMHIIVGPSDVGKSELSRDLSEDVRWNAIRFEGSTLLGGVGNRITSEIQLLLGHAHDAAAFLDAVSVISRSARGVPFGVVLDGFDDWMTRSGDVGDLPQWLHRFEAMGSKVIVLTRPSELSRLQRHPLLQQFCSRSVIDLPPLSNTEMDEFVSKYFRRFRIGGQLEGAARDICRIPAMLSIVAETYEGQSGIDPALTRDGLYDRYKERKVEKLSLRHGTSAMQWVIALDDVASLMQRTDKAAMLYSDLVRAVGLGSVAALIDEEVLVSIDAGGLEDHYVKFRYGQFRDHILWRKAVAEGRILPPLVVTDAEGEGNP